VIDSLYNAFAGNENSRNEVNRFLNALGQLALDLNGGQGGAVVVLAHPSRAGRETGEGGSTAWSDAARSRLHFHRPKPAEGEEVDPDARELACQKLNFGPDGERLALRWNDGLFALDGVSSGNFVDSIDRRTRERRAEDAFLTALDKLDKQGRKVNMHKNQPNYAPKEMATLAICSDFRKRDLEQAMHRLLDTEAIRILEQGPASRRRSFIVRSQAQAKNGLFPDSGN
jgi:RecA-family ATPase